jgi:glycosyltransferase involved in cell wall biosynthesis
MKIVYIMTQSKIGGVGVHLRDLSSRMRQEGHEVVVLLGEGNELDSLLKIERIEFYKIPHLRRSISLIDDIQACFEIRNFLKQIKPDLVSTHCSKAGVLGRLVCLNLGLPVIFTAHGFAFTEGIPSLRRRIFRWVEKLMAPVAGKILTVSEHDRQLALEANICVSRKIRTVHNGMPDIPQRFLADPSIEPPKIIMVARFDKQKDQLLLLKALARLREMPWGLEFVGDGPLRKLSETFVSEMGLWDRVKFAGTCTNIPERLSDSQIFALVSNWEGLPRTIIEAMRAGLPVIASDVGGSSELVENGKTGFVIPRGDLDELTKRLCLILSNPKVRMAMGGKGRSVYESHFTFERMFQENLGIYKAVVRQRSIWSNGAMRRATSRNGRVATGNRDAQRA